jgi:thiosulfate reductase/polysulfide reductase chain A
MFAENTPGALEWGVALEQTPACLQTVRAIGLLPGITGSIDVPGGSILGMHIHRNAEDFRKLLSDEIKDKRMGAEEFRILCGRNSMYPSAHIPTLFKAMRTGEPYPVKAFLIFGNNGLVSYANSKMVYKTLMALDFISVMDIYMTPTAEMADIVLPAATWLEIDEVVGLPFVAGNVILAQQKVVSMHECRPDEEVFIDLARKLELNAGTESLEEIYDEQLKPAGITFKELKARGFVTADIEYRKYEKSGFHTPSGKVELYSSIMEQEGYDPLPLYVEPPESPVSTPEVHKEYPLILITGGRSQYYFHTEYRQIPSLRKKEPDPYVDIHPVTAAEEGILNGDWVWIETLRGRIQQRARITEDIDPRVVNVSHGWWFPEEKGPEHGVWKSNANVLTNNGPPYDPAIGTYQLRALLCRIYKKDNKTWT